MAGSDSLEGSFRRPLTITMVVRSKLHWRPQDLADAKTMGHPPRKALSIEWSWPKIRAVGATGNRSEDTETQGCWNIGDVTMSPRCQARSCKIWCLLSWVSVFLWSSLSLLSIPLCCNTNVHSALLHTESLQLDS